jgi:hypothetical protein
MRQRPVSLMFQLALSATLLLLAACAPAPIYKNTAGVVIAAPSQVAQAPENFSNSRVIWGGRIVHVIRRAPTPASPADWAWVSAFTEFRTPVGAPRLN